MGGEGEGKGKGEGILGACRTHVTHTFHSSPNFVKDIELLPTKNGKQFDKFVSYTREVVCQREVGKIKQR